MATIVNLNLGGDEEEEGQVYAADLILTSPYVEPTDNLLVLRSRPDIDEPIDGTLAVTEATDRGAFDALARLPIEPVIGTLMVTGRGDTASFAGVVTARATTGTMAATERPDTVLGAGDGFVGIAQRTGTLTATEARDTASIASVFTMKWVGWIDATEPGDVVQAQGGFIEYTGPGFLNSTERPDTAAFSGRIVYDVTGELTVTEVGDTASIIGRTPELLDGTISDIVQVIDVVELIPLGVTLSDYIWFSDSLAESPDIATVDTVYVQDELASGLRVSQAQTDTLVAQDALGVIFSGDIADTVLLSETLITEIPLITVDRVWLTETLASTLVVSGSLADSVKVTDELQAVFAAVAVDTVTVTDELDSVVDGQGVLLDRVLCVEVNDTQLATSSASVDTGVFTDELASQEIVDAEISVTATIQDDLTSQWVSHDVDTVYVTDTLTTTEFTTAELADTVVYTDELTSAIAVYVASLTDTVVFTDLLDAATDLQLVGVLSDTVLVGDTLHDAAQTVYVVNADTGAVSTYTFTPTVTGMAFFRRTLYLAGPDGLFAVDADEDEDGAVVWTLKTGFSNLGTDLLKRIQDVNIQGRTAGDTTMQVVSDRYGKKQEWNYRLPELTRDSYRDGVVKPGRGVQSVYYALGLHGVGPAEIDQLRVVVEPLSRRR
jgi:hypothetical protein